ncbi:Uncharacterized protein TCAP_06896 [Tolypocladium capitatum]|uniref:Heterokaryon incompatibility domain-containing protein n=1 Tax=Tolypocladium capitatum TaxID=45235 RepID=A0A2K3Q6F3_9HYPO|nr:Uncharacterized protein TCAP_06896 [Tolypocladium capitatum]
MLCKVCCEGLQGIWDPSKTKRVCHIDEFRDDDLPIEDSKFVWFETVKTVEPQDPEFCRPEHYMFGHHLTQQSFEQSVRDGCVMCEIFKPSNEAQEVKPDPKITALGYYSLFSIDFRDCPIMCMYVNDSRGGFELSSHVVQDENMNLNISPSTGDDTTWAIIQGWLDTCLQAHPRCNERPCASLVPTRLLQLETDATGPEPVFRVVHATQVEPGTRYITLSHCYGADDDGLQLTQSTLAHLSTLQPISILPLTFRDALAVVARLGLAHLWIDRLCILQDDPSDQRAEASKTLDVFRNAFLSIAASGTASSSAGLFSTRDPALVAPTVFDFPVDAAGTTIPFRSSLEMPFGWKSAFCGDPLSQSARALQERLFAPRVVHFGSSMVFWECHGANCVETQPRGVNGTALGGITGPEGDKEEAEDGGDMWRRNKPWKTLLNAPACSIQHDPIRQVFANWFEVLRTYSGCAVTAPEEKLLAVAGVAGDMKRLLRERGCEQTEYLAGMWMAMLPGGLLWNVCGIGSRPAAYRAPSWSWAAVDATVNFHDMMPEEAGGDGLLCELVSAATTPCTADETGEVTAGSVVLRGKLALGKLHAPFPSPHRPRNETMQIKSLIDVDGGGATLAEHLPDSPSGYDQGWVVVFDTVEDVGDEILCLPIRTRMWSDIGYHIHGLALSRLDDGCYVRRGKWGILVDTEQEALGIFEGLPERELEIV